MRRDGPLRLPGPCSLIRTVTLVFVLFVMLAPASETSAQQAATNGAGLVVRHGDGTLIYAYVEFQTEKITGEELLLRSGLGFVIAPFGGLGSGICAIDGEGCPADDCYCASYESPATFWQYFGWTGSDWNSHLRGPTTRQLSDGDIDGWSWTAGDHGLPPVTIEEIAAITGFDRTPDPTATATTPPTPIPTATPIPPATPTARSTPTVTPANTPEPTSTPAVPPTTMPIRTATATEMATATATSTVADSTPTMTPTASPTSTLSPASTPTATSSATLEATETQETQATPTSGAGAVIVRPGETPETLEPDTGGSDDASESILLFGGVALVIIGVGSVVLIRNRINGA